MKQEYIERITEQLNRCNNISLLDLIFQLMKKDGDKYEATTSQAH